jgi:thiamine pyrophosphate-dependent acetolactate synthase large subunit-like protein
MGHATVSALVSYMKAGGRFISARHENAAVNMADGWARMTGEVGLASVTVGPGLTQIATALVTASRGGTPLVVFVGEPALVRSRAPSISPTGGSFRTRWCGAAGRRRWTWRRAPFVSARR